MTAADLMLDVLAAHGVRDVFGVPGDAINDFTTHALHHQVADVSAENFIGTLAHSGQIGR